LQQPLIEISEFSLFSLFLFHFSFLYYTTKTTIFNPYVVQYNKMYNTTKKLKYILFIV